MSTTGKIFREWRKCFLGIELKCSRCGEWKNSQDFNSDKDLAFGKKSECKVCSSKRFKELRKK